MACAIPRHGDDCDCTNEPETCEGRAFCEGDDLREVVDYESGGYPRKRLVCGPCAKAHRDHIAEESRGDYLRDLEKGGR